jgi:putative molybdopterin biosynthesis protein
VHHSRGETVSGRVKAAVFAGPVRSACFHLSAGVRSFTATSNGPAMRLLTTAEAADYLRLKERKLYELVAESAIPCTKVTGKWLFPQAELDHWLASNLVRPLGLNPVEPLPIVGGSHDPLLEWALRESGSGLATLPEGSEAGLTRFAKGGIVASALHLHSLDDGGDPNVDTVRRDSALKDAVLIGFNRREQGLLVAPGNPLGLATIADVAAARARIATRPQGAGAQLLLLALLHRAKRSLDDLVVTAPPCPTGPDVAQAIRAARADCGIATRSVADGAGVGFVPIVWESFDLLVRQHDYFRGPLQNFFQFVRSPAFAARARELGGYDVTPAGQVRLAP